MASKKKTRGGQGKKKHSGNKRAAEKTITSSESKANNDAIAYDESARRDNGTSLQIADSKRIAQMDKADSNVKSEFVSIRALVRHIHADEDLETLATYLAKQNRYDSAGLARAMPCTALELRKGSLAAEEVDTELSYLVGQLYGDHIEAADIEVTVQDVCLNLAHHLTVLALPDRFFNFGKLHSGTNSTFIETFDLMRQEFFKELCKAGSELDLVENIDDYLDSWETILEVQCKKWASTLDSSLFHSKHGTFLRLCPAYKQTDTTVRNEMTCLVKSIYSCRFQEIQQEYEAHLHEAVSGIADGVHLLDMMCWECETVVENLKTCGHCGVASYCGETCRAKAWKHGHRNACSILAVKQKLFQESLHAMDEAYKSGILEALELDPHQDYHLLRINIQNLQKRLRNGIETPKLSMASYYKSLKKIFRREWWLFDEIEDNDIVGEILPENFSSKFAAIQIHLCVEGISGGDHVPSNATFAMSRDQFLTCFENKEFATLGNEEARISVVRQEKMRSIKFFRDTHHKIIYDEELLEENVAGVAQQEITGEETDALGSDYVIDRLGNVTITCDDEAEI